MHRPRRTSEFQEEPGTSTKLSRIPHRVANLTELTHFGAAQKATTRQTTPVMDTKHKTDLTPQTTPSHSTQKLFSHKKQHPTALHNDKKWIQCQAQHITDYLQRSWEPGNMENIPKDFFSRPNCLQQMSIKQFVSIINYFLRFIWGNHYLVGSNHVKDIVKILRKLDYPYQVNKSWLKTPNTINSFGNVMMLFDFLMDFVPDPDFDFSLQELPETQSQNEISDLEFKSMLLKNCEKSFHLWDKQMDEEYQKIKHQTADLLVQKRCDISGLNELDTEIERLNEAYEKEQKERPFIASEDKRECERLKEYLKNSNRKLEEVLDMYSKEGRKLEDLLAKKQKCLMEIANTEKENENCEKSVKEQICYVKQRVTYIEKAKSMHLELQSYEHTIEDLRKHEHCQQQQLSVAKMKVTKLIEIINKTLRGLVFQLPNNEISYHLQIPLNANTQNIESLVPALREQFNKIKDKIEVYKEVMRELETNIEKLYHEITISLKPQIKTQKKALKNALKANEKYKKTISNEFEEISAKIRKINAQINRAQLEIDTLQKLISDNKFSVFRIERENERIIQNGEVSREAYDRTEKAFDENFERNLESFRSFFEFDSVVERNKGF